MMRAVMKERKHFYISNKNLLTWLMVLCMVGSAVTRIVFVGMKGSSQTSHMWSQIILPTAAALLFAFIGLISGKERFYKTALPVWMICIYYCFLFANLDFQNFYLMIVALYCIMMLFIAIMYTTVTSGKFSAPLLLLPLLALPLVAQLYLQRTVLTSSDYTELLPDILMMSGCMISLFALRVHTDGQYHPTWGDRVDGRRVRTLPAMSQVSPYIMVERNDATNLISDSFEITHTERYIRAKRREGYANFGLMHVFLASYCRTIAKYPAVNRFLAGQKVYYRGNDIQFCLAIKKEMSTNAPSTVIKVHLSPYDTAIDVYNKINAAVENVKDTPLDSNFDNTAGALTMIPGVFLKFVVWLLKTLDYFGLLPKFLLEVSPFHGSVFFTSMGSLGIPPIYHHLYNFGNLPVFCAFGLKRRELEPLEDGTIVQRKYVDMNMATDERIVDGFYYATFFKYFKRLALHPELLDNPPENVRSDID